MLTRFPDFYDEFQCLAGDCPDTCCGAWNIVLDPAAKARFDRLEGALGERLRAVIRPVDGEDCIVLKDGRCPMLTDDGLCTLILEHGADFICDVCRIHPRFTEIYGGLQETALDLSCPRAAQLLLERNARLQFITRTDDAPPEPNDLEPELFQSLLLSRQMAMAILQDRDAPLSDRLALLLCFAQRIDRNLPSLTRCTALCRRYGSADYRRRQLLRIRRLRRHGTMTHARQLLLAMEHLTARFPQAVRELEKTGLEDAAVPLEQLAVYYIYRWWLKAACDGQLWRQAAATVVSVLAVASLARTMGDVMEAARLYTREVEHSEDNLALLRRAMDLPHFSRNRLLSILEVPHAI